VSQQLSVLFQAVLEAEVHKALERLRRYGERQKVGGQAAFRSGAGV
jgi:hypothetical protein